MVDFTNPGLEKECWKVPFSHVYGLGVLGTAAQFRKMYQSPILTGQSVQTISHIHLTATSAGREPDATESQREKGIYDETDREVRVELTNYLCRQRGPGSSLQPCQRLHSATNKRGDSCVCVH